MKIVERLPGAESLPKDAVLAEIARLEAGLGLALPTDYRDFLSTHNGGRPAPSVFRFTEANTPTESEIQCFFGLLVARSVDLTRKAVLFAGRIPPGFLPIGTDSLGNLLLLSLDKPTFGSVWFWDHEAGAQVETRQGMIPVAASFSALATSLV